MDTDAKVEQTHTKAIIVFLSNMLTLGDSVRQVVDQMEVETRKDNFNFVLCTL